MDWQRYGLLAAMVVVFVLLAQEWLAFSEQQDQLPVATMQPQVATSSANSNNIDVPEGSTPQGDDFVPTLSEADSQAPAVSAPVDSSALISVTTDNMIVAIDPVGGDIVKVDLLDHYRDLDGKLPFPMLNNVQGQFYIAQSGLVGRNATDTSDGRPTFTSQKTDYQLGDNEDSLFVDLNYQQGEVAITKRFSFSKGSHAIEVEYIIDNRTSEIWSGAMYGQIKRDDHQPIKTAQSLGVQPFLGAAYTTPGDNYKKVDFDELKDTTKDTEITGGWVALVQHYFVSAWIPPQESLNKISLRRRGGHNLLFFTTAPFNIAPGEKNNVAATFYVGPKNVDVLDELAPYLDLTVDYGWFWWLAKPLFHGLDLIHKVVGNWGWSIVVLTLIIKAVFFYPSAISYRSMAKMRKLGPMMQDLKDRYGDDRQKMSQELMKVYKKEGVNPMTGCLPMLIQMPVFMALYWMLIESVELRHAPFMFYITDLSARDPYLILAVLMGLSMFLQQKLQPTPPDPMQAKIMQSLPIVFGVMGIFFPAGLLVYWVVNNALTILQMWVITRNIEQEGSPAKAT
jgi:YidC/Oxa1 family membrane protein insertase